MIPNKNNELMSSDEVDEPMSTDEDDEQLSSNGDDQTMDSDGDEQPMDSDGDEAPICFCGLPAKLWVSRTSKNPFRLFYNCRKYPYRKQCDFFEWCDADTQPTNEWHDGKPHVSGDKHVDEINLIRSECIHLQESIMSNQKRHNSESAAWYKEKAELTSELSRVKSELEEIKRGTKLPKVELDEIKLPKKEFDEDDGIKLPKVELDEMKLPKNEFDEANDGIKLPKAELDEIDNGLPAKEVAP